MDWLSLISNITALATLGLSFFIFLSDPLRRWSFFGFKPTAIIILYNSQTKEVLLIQNTNIDQWYFPQSGIYTNDINGAVDQSLQRELNISQINYKFVETIPLGYLKSWRKIKEKYSPGGISLFPSWRGKCYLACIILVDSEEVKKEIKLGHGIQKSGWFTITESQKLISTSKLKLLKKVLDQLHGEPA